jgi:hypothetical protein
LNDDDAFVKKIGLIDPRVAPQRMRALIADALELEISANDVLTSRFARFGLEGTCGKGDVVFVRSPSSDIAYNAAQIWFVVSVQGLALAMLSEWDFVSTTQNATTWSIQHNPTLVDLKDIVAVCSFKMYRTTCITILPSYMKPPR